MDNLNTNFINYLIRETKASKVTLRYYKSDLTHFTGWLLLRARVWGILADGLSELLSIINFKVVCEYKDYMITNNTPSKTINRRFSTLRHLSKFMLATGIATSDFMVGVTNISSIIPKEPKSPAESVIVDFKKHLEKEQVSQSTIKNYLSDVNQFLNWIQNHAQTV